VTATLKPGDTGAETVVSIHTSLNVTGRPAQFGRSLLPEVSGKLIQQFATNLEAMVIADTATDEIVAEEVVAEIVAAETLAAETAAEPAAPVAKRAAAPPVKQEDSLNAFKFVVVPILKRLIPVAAIGAAGAAITVIFRRSRSKKS
jgi:hypothetical protein